MARSRENFTRLRGLRGVTPAKGKVLPPGRTLT